MPTHRAEAEWTGNLAAGSGRLRVGSGAFEGPYSFKSRFEEGQSATNPEELIGAARAGCFTMALAAQLSRAGITPTRIHTGASVKLEKVGEAFAITQIALETEAQIPGIDAATFQKYALARSADARGDRPRARRRGTRAVNQRDCRNRFLGSAAAGGSGDSTVILRAGTLLAAPEHVLAIRSATIGAFVLLGAVAAYPQVASINDLSCFGIRDQVPRGSFRAILNGLDGQSCRIKVPATIACIATQGTTLTPPPPATSASSVPGSVLCYRARCAPPRPGRTDVEDAFGRRPVRFRGARWLCLPASVGGSATTTIPAVTTTTLPGATTTTSTTVPGTPEGCHFSDGQCRGTCAPGQRCGSAAGTGSCECRSTSCGEADAPACNGACADPGKACVFVVTGCECINVPG
jgi:osmotically inducible protein OsmC